MTAARRFTLNVPVTIRACREEDVPQLEWFGAFTHHRAIIREAFELQSCGEAVMLLAVAGGFPIGQAWLDLRPRLQVPFPMVWAVRVLEPFQGAGLGARLMAALEEAAADRGYRGLQLGVEQENDRARAFYERLGWRVTGERRESYGYTTPDGQAVAHQLHEWVMAKNLDQAASDRPSRA
jgi:ribosomal protein S18 acetylase RimI-like enzyme